MYKLIKNSKGNRWMKDGKFIKEADVPQEIKDNQGNLCLFCGGIANHKRKVAEVMVALCDDSYYKETIGSITAELRKKGLIHGVHKEEPVGSSA